MMIRRSKPMALGVAVLSMAVGAFAVLPGRAQSQGSPSGAGVSGCGATASVNTTAPYGFGALPDGGFVTIGAHGAHTFDAAKNWTAGYLTDVFLVQGDVGPDGRIVVAGNTTNRSGAWIIDPATGTVDMVPIDWAFRPTASFWAGPDSLYTYNIATGVSLVSLDDGSLRSFFRPPSDRTLPVASDTAGRLYLQTLNTTSSAVRIQRVLPDGTLDIEFDASLGATSFAIDPATDRLVEIGDAIIVYAEDGSIASSIPSGITPTATPPGFAVLVDGRLLASDAGSVYESTGLTQPLAPVSSSRPAFVTNGPAHALGYDGSTRVITTRIDTQSGAIVTVAGDLVYRMELSDLDATVIRSVAGAGGATHVLVDGASGQRGVGFAPSSPIEPISPNAVALADATGPIRTVDLAGNLRSVYPPESTFLPGSDRPIVAAYIADDVGIAYRLYPDGSVTAQSTDGGSETTIVTAASYPSAPTVHDVAMADGRIWVADSTNGFVAFSATDGSYLGVVDAIDGFGGLPVIDAVAIMYLDGLVAVDRGTLAISLIECSVLAAPMPPSSGPIVQPEFTG